MYATLISCFLGTCKVSREDQSVHECINGERHRYAVEDGRIIGQKLPAQLRTALACACHEPETCSCEEVLSIQANVVEDCGVARV